MFHMEQFKNIGSSVTLARVKGRVAPCPVRKDSA